MRKDERRPVPLRDQVRERERLARARDALQDQPVVPALQPFVQRGDGLGLVARGLELGFQLERTTVHSPLRLGTTNPSSRIGLAVSA